MGAKHRKFVTGDTVIVDKVANRPYQVTATADSLGGKNQRLWLVPAWDKWDTTQRIVDTHNQKVEVA